MFILQYGSDYQTNLIKLKNDLYVYFNTFVPIELMEDDIYFYTNEFVAYFNQIYALISNFENEIENLKYNIEFIIIFDSNIPKIILNSIYLSVCECACACECAHVSAPDNSIGNLSSKIKKSDYDKLTNILNFNYETVVNINPYYIIKIMKTDNFVNYSDFYLGKLILLKNIITDEKIEINFDSNLLFFYHADELDNIDEIEPNGFKFYNNKLIVYDGPVFKITKLENNYVKLDEQIYLIDPISTIDIAQLLQ